MYPTIIGIAGKLGKGCWAYSGTCISRDIYIDSVRGQLSLDPGKVQETIALLDKAMAAPRLPSVNCKV